MAASSTVVDLVNQMPDLDKSGELTGPQWPDVEVVYRKVLEGGPDAVTAVAGLLVPPGEGNDYKARYLLHGLALFVCRPEGAPWRGAFIQALLSQLDADRPKAVKSFLVQQLQVAGTSETALPLGRLLLDPELCEPAAQALLAIRTGAVEQFRQALPQARGASRLTIVQALGVMRDVQSIPALETIAKDSAPDARLAALEALAGMGAPSMVDLLLKAADASTGYERIAATEACFVLAERLIAAGHEADAGRIYAQLSKRRTTPHEQHVADAAERAWATIARNDRLVPTGLDPRHAPRQGEGWLPLFNGRDLSGWKGRHGDLGAWKVIAGEMVNDVRPGGTPGSDILTTDSFYDFEIYYEYRIPEGSNSGVYLRGRYEIQIWDDYGKTPRDGEVAKRFNGALYKVAAPASQVSKPPNQWQSVFARIRDNQVTIVLNGTPIIESARVHEPTGGHYDERIGEPGPIMIQGDHGRINLRHLYIRPLAGGADPEPGN